MGNTNNVVTFESEVMSRYEALGAEINQVSLTPRYSPTGGGVITPDGGGGAPANSQPCPVSSLPPSMEPAAYRKVRVAQTRTTITRTRTDFFEKLERAVLPPPQNLGNKRRRPAWTAEGPAEEWEESSRCADRKTVAAVVSTCILDSGSKRDAKMSTEVAAGAVPDAVEGEVSVQRDGLRVSSSW